MSCDQKDQDWQVTKCSITERFCELLRLSHWTDCIFIVGEDNVEIKCHKLVLAVSSPVLEALFFGGLSNSSSEPIKVPDIEPHVFRMFLKYMYTDSLKLKCVEDAGSLLYVAKKYIMPQLSKLCLDFLLEKTCIQSLWDVLAIGEALDEEPLIEAVLKIMCRFGRHVWYKKSEHLSVAMLKRLLNEQSSNITEEDLWSIAIDWAHKDCIDRGISTNGIHVRDALDREKLLDKVRFLVFNNRNFQEDVVHTQVLTKLEIDAVTKIIQDTVEQKDNKGRDDNCDVPNSLCPIKKRRRRVSRVIWKCTREKIKGDTMWICCDQFICSVVSHNLILVTGLEVPTRSVYSARECYPWLGSLHPAGTYNERLSICITEEDGRVIATTEYDAWVPYDSVQVITLEEEIWFEADRCYYVIFELSSGSYELFNRANNVQSKGTVFSFRDQSDHSRSGYFCGSFVVSLLYCL